MKNVIREPYCGLGDLISRRDKGKKKRQRESKPIGKNTWAKSG